MTELCTSSTIAIAVQAHANPKRAVTPEPMSGPIIWPSEKDDAIRLLRALTELSADAPHEAIISARGEANGHASRPVAPWSGAGARETGSPVESCADRPSQASSTSTRPSR